MPPVQAIFFDIGDTLVFDDPPLRERLSRAAQAVGLHWDAARLPAAFRAGEAYAVGRYVEGVAWDDPDSLREALARVFGALDRVAFKLRLPETLPRDKALKALGFDANWIEIL